MNGTNFNELLGVGTCTMSDKEPEPLTLEKLQEATNLIKDISGKPIKNFMLSKGFDPDKGDIAIFPSITKEYIGTVVPDFVKFSDFVEDVFLMKKPMFPYEDFKSNT